MMLHIHVPSIPGPLSTDLIANWRFCNCLRRSASLRHRISRTAAAASTMASLTTCSLVTCARRHLKTPLSSLRMATTASQATSRSRPARLWCVLPHVCLLPAPFRITQAGAHSKREAQQGRRGALCKAGCQAPSDREGWRHTKRC
jgi:hypothetical protein